MTKERDQQKQINDKNRALIDRLTTEVREMRSDRDDLRDTKQMGTFIGNLKEFKALTVELEQSSEEKWKKI